MTPLGLTQQPPGRLAVLACLALAAAPSRVRRVILTVMVQ